MTNATSTTIPDVLLEKPRISSIDIVRGIVMVIMALDHTRDFFHADANLYNPTDLSKTTTILFFTRWITHYCAPTFVFLSGVSVYISQQRKTKKELTFFLLTRGIWLLLLEFTVIRLGIIFNLYYDVLVFQVIWVIGLSMVVLSGLIYLPFRAIVAIGVLIVAGHDLLHGISFAPEDPFFVFFSLFHRGGFITVSPGVSFLIMYPFLPWLGIMLLGYGVGRWYVKGIDPAARKKFLLRAGLSAVGLFIVLRGVNLYGDPAPWALQQSGIFTLLSFLNTTKYPPSLLYTLMTIGPGLILLAWLEGKQVDLLKPFVVFGRVPMLYYILHFYLIHLASVVSYMIIAGKSFAEIDFHFSTAFGGIPYGYGYGLVVVYAVWISVVLVLYPICSAYNRYKSTHDAWWLSYL